MCKFTLILEFDGYKKAGTGTTHMSFEDFQKITKYLESEFEPDSTIASITPRIENYQECDH
jgi:hypothetical protein